MMRPPLPPHAKRALTHKLCVPGPITHRCISMPRPDKAAAGKRFPAGRGLACGGCDFVPWARMAGRIAAADRQPCETPQGLRHLPPALDARDHHVHHREGRVEMAVRLELL